MQRKAAETGARRGAWLAGALLSLCLLAAAAAPGVHAGEIPPSWAEGEPRPSIVVIQTDDQTLDSLYETFRPFPGAGQVRAMPNTLDLIGKRGMTFNRYYIPYPLCCPSRVSLLTGRYSHNNNVRGNNPPREGYLGFAARAASRHNIATWLQAAGYRTVHVGKVMNGYGEPPHDDGTSVPPGWDAWYGTVNQDKTHHFYGYRMNANGTIVGPFGEPGSLATREYGIRDEFGCPRAPRERPCNHITDVFTRIATEEMVATGPKRPLYLQLDYTAPHGDFRRPAGPEPAPRHYDWFKGARLPHNRSEGLNEGNVTDKPRFIRDAPYLTARERRIYRVYYQKQLDSLRSVDDGVKAVFDALGSMGRLRNTYVVFTSDNGFFFGEHRLLGGKFLAYEPSTHMPFLIRGPGIEPGSESGELAANIDVAPTLLELAGAKATKSIDGRSLVPYLEDPEKRSRRPILFESFVQSADLEADGEASSSRRGGEATASILAPPKDYAGIRLGPYKYIAWPSGEKELYDIEKDPNELNSLHRVPNLFPIRNFLHRQMKRLIDCVGKVCREATPELPLTRTQAAKLRAERAREIRERERERERARRERERNR